MAPGGEGASAAPGQEDRPVVGAVRVPILHATCEQHHRVVQQRAVAFFDGAHLLAL